MSNDVYNLDWVKAQPPKPIVEPKYGSETSPNDQKNAKNPSNAPIETDPGTTKDLHQKAKNELAQKNRKAKHGPIMELPFDPTIEEGSKYDLVGFAPNFDGPWLIHEVTFTFQGKGGSRLNIELMDPASQHITAGPNKSVADQRTLLKSHNVGAVQKPTPINPQGGNIWLPIPLVIAPPGKT